MLIPFEFFMNFLFIRNLIKTRKTYQVYLFCIFVSRLQKCRFERLEVQQTMHLLTKNQHFDAKSAQNLHIPKKTKNDREKSPNLHILKKVKKKNLRLYVALTGVDELVFDFVDFCLSICRFGDFSLSKLLMFLSIWFCALLASKC